jgi:hypothetical protein
MPYGGHYTYEKSEPWYIYYTKQLYMEYIYCICTTQSHYTEDYAMARYG